MRIDRAGMPFILGALVPAVVLAVARRPGWAVPFAVLGVCFGFFFRDPDRRVAANRDEVVAPADGRVLVAGRQDVGDAPPGKWIHVSIFLSPLDVHVNRAPTSGHVLSVEHRPGRFLPAYRADAATANERTELWIDHDGQSIVCRQIVGVLARRIVCRVRPGHELRIGERIGLMKFGSRMDVFLPVTARLHVHVGQMVRGGETILATLHPSTGATDAGPRLTERKDAE